MPQPSATKQLFVSLAAAAALTSLVLAAAPATARSSQATQPGQPAQAPQSAQPAQPAPQVDFATDIQPFFAAYCHECHGPERATREANLRLDEKQFAFRDLGAGYHTIVPGDAEGSEVFARINSEFAEDRMPPYATGIELTKDEINLVKRWINEGANWPDIDPNAANTAAETATTAARPRRGMSGIPAISLPDQPIIINTHAIPEVRLVVLARGLSHPWSLAFLPKGDMLITERSGNLRIVRDGVLVPAPISGIPTDIIAKGLSGMMEVAIHPDFENNGYVYLTYTRDLKEAGGTVALVRGVLEGLTLTNVEDVFVAEPWVSDDQAGTTQGGNSSATASARLAFAPDGKLFMTMGGSFGVERDDGTSSFFGNGMLAQDPNSHAGKLLRLNDDGTAPKDNPFYGRPDHKPEVYSIGHRNQMGLVFHPTTGQPYATEHGPQGGDELNAIEPGGNYGWPVVSYGRHYDGPRIAKQFWREGMKEPLVYWVPSIAPSGLAFYTGEQFPEWKGNLFVGALMEGRIPRTGHLERIIFNPAGEELGRESLLTDLRQRIRDVRQGPDGLIYILTEEAQAALIRLEPVPAPAP